MSQPALHSGKKSGRCTAAGGKKKCRNFPTLSGGEGRGGGGSGSARSEFVWGTAWGHSFGGGMRKWGSRFGAKKRKKMGSDVVYFL